MNVNVIVIGGGPAGVITALTAKSVYPEKSVCIIKEIGDAVIPCAIPYMMHTLSFRFIRSNREHRCYNNIANQRKADDR